MNNSNNKTLQAYEGHVQEYIDGTPQGIDGIHKIWMDRVLTGVSKTADILEIGSAFGRDAEYMQSLGFKVQCTDAPQSFVDLLNEKGFSAKKLNVLTDPITERYDLVIANAVFLHFTRDEIKIVLRKIYDSLKTGGRIAFTVKEGEGEKWSDEKLGVPRYFCYWQEDGMREVVESAGYSNVEISGDNVTRKNTSWLQIIAEK